MDTNGHSVLVIGLPKTGKTTFLAALWDVVDTENVEGSLVLESVEGDSEHLNTIRDLWANCKEIPRTRIGEEKTVSMKLRDRRSDVRGHVSFPDMDGETFQSQWTDRAWTESYAEMVQRSDSVMLFIHPSRVKEGALIRDARPLIAAITEGPGDPAAPPPPQVEPGGEPAAPGQRGTPTQVQVVELLQFVRRSRRGTDGMRLGVIISAWDVVMKQGSATPDDWLRKSMPLLHQYLVANREEICFRVYGVSAQGGDIIKDAASLRKKDKPSERIIVFEGKTRSSDISIPVRWVMGATQD